MHPGLTYKVSTTRIDDMHREATHRRIANPVRRQARSPFRRRVPKRLLTWHMRERPA